MKTVNEEDREWFSFEKNQEYVGYLLAEEDETQISDLTTDELVELGSLVTEKASDAIQEAVAEFVQSRNKNNQ